MTKLRTAFAVAGLATDVSIAVVALVVALIVLGPAGTIRRVMSGGH